MYREIHGVFQKAKTDLSNMNETAVAGFMNMFGAMEHQAVGKFSVFMKFH